MLRKLVVGFIQANCYILGCDETKEGLVIDPGDEVSRIMKQIAKDKLNIRYILITHGHVDHIGGAEGLKEQTGAPVWIHKLDAKALPFEPDGLLEDGQEITIGKVNVGVIHTPGHSPGGVSFQAPGAVFTGDTLFEGSIGRTDLRGGSHKTLIQSVVKNIFPLGDDLRVYPGHGPRSTIGTEKKHNPFFQ